ncbi:MAG: capsule assembly Wzi family protein [Gammaproteobacteria bacterium]
MAGAHSGKRPNVAYEHSTYLSGYRYYGRNMAPSLDNDTRTVSLQADHYFTAGSQLSWRLAKLISTATA